MSIGTVIKAIVVIGIVGALVGFALADSPRQVIELKDETTVVMRGEVDSMSVARVQAELMKKAANGKPLVLVMDTPGGSVVDGNNLIDFIRGLPVRVDTLTLFAASMGFQIVQNAQTRYILPSGVLMSHRMAGGIQGQIPGELNTRLDFWGRVGLRLDQVASQRMGISLNYYRALIQDEYWVEGEEAVRFRAADKVIVARCAQDMSGTVNETVYTIFGPIDVTFAKCPLISGPLAFSFKDSITREQTADAIKLVGERYGRKVKK